MPRRARGPYLYLDPKRRTWTIRDGTRFVRTGCGEGERGKAETALAQYLGHKHRPTPSADPLIDDVLNAYTAEHGPHTRRPDNVVYTINNLLKWWSGRRVSECTARHCRSYTRSKSSAGARRDLETLRSAIRYWHREYGPLSSMPSVVLPAKSEPRDRWLTRSEAARLLWAARKVEHLKRFILIGLYTGSRSGDILKLRWDWIDFDRGIMRRRGIGESESNKRRPPVRLGRRIVSHMRRWRQIDASKQVEATTVISFNGEPVGKMRRSWHTARCRAGLDESVTPHALRRTRATWLMQEGVDIWEAAGHLGMSPETLTRIYAQHSPDHQKRAAEV
jgi:integrase